ncbi:Crp/Fnr family transcriptional regulator [Pedobacter sp. SYSU D00535]|uniref:Crp/Fnr family transcriptional regulator n=1 Tax=Pedobacter sp. SYSU D00535 TaxID=2810308 RepID=UPI001A9749FE|nr:cyclic nucleotide-binding domain-containing protein [Pedobacter sp. SYSU D00535]
MISEIQGNIYRKFLEKFVSFTDEEWAIFLPVLELKKLKKKSFFMEAGKVCQEVGFILQGTVRCYYVKDGTEVTTYFSFENELISSYKSFLTETPSITYVEAMENTELIVFSKKSLQLLLEDSRIKYKMERFGRTVAEYYLCCYDDRVFSFVTQTPEQRYLELLSSRSDILARIPQHYIANYLGITPVSLSRIRSRIMKPHISLLETLQSP